MLLAPPLIAIDARRFSERRRFVEVTLAAAAAEVGEVRAEKEAEPC